MVTHACHPSNGRKLKIGEGQWFRLAWAKKRDPTSKITKAKRAGDRAQVVEHLPCKYKAVSSNLGAAKK
jgi:hypothetical protein